MRLRPLAVLAGVLAVLSVPAQAHHSFTSFFDLEKTVEVSGVVKSVKLVNPHPEMIVEVTAPDGTKATWTIVGRATGSGILRAGWNTETVPVGTNVKVEGHPSRKADARTIAAGKITKADGSEVWFGGGGGIAAG